ncbi:GerAB/ArcD/ProY family transporter [Paenibacillus thalictri]|nr:endospore germination permease [Paenibacillus thalictri]
MLDKGKISAFQMGIMMYPTVVVTGILLLPSLLAQAVGRDFWLSPVWGAAGGYFIVWICCWLYKRYPNQSIVQYSERIIGKIPGKLAGLLIIWFYLQLNGYVVREYGELLVGAFFPRTPILLVMGSLLLVSACAVRGGVEVLGRSAQLFVPVVCLLFVLVVLLLIKELDLRNIIPIMEDGMMPSLLGSLVPFGGWYGEFLIISFLLPSLTDSNKGMKWAMVSNSLIMFTMVVTNLVVLTLFGNAAPRTIYPMLEAARYIEYGDFLEHVEAVVMAIWILGVFVKISMFYYVVVIGASQWLKLADFRMLIFPVGLLVLILTVWGAASLQELAHTIGTAGPFYYATIQYLLPVILAATAWVRKQAQSGDLR